MVDPKNHNEGGEELLSMDQYEFIRTAHRVYGKNISELSRMTGHSRNTVKKAIRGEPWGYRRKIVGKQGADHDSLLSTPEWVSFGAFPPYQELRCFSTS